MKERDCHVGSLQPALSQVQTRRVLAIITIVQRPRCPHPRPRHPLSTSLTLMQTWTWRRTLDNRSRGLLHAGARLFFTLPPLRLFPAPLRDPWTRMCMEALQLED